MLFAINGIIKMLLQLYPCLRYPTGIYICSMKWQFELGDIEKVATDFWQQTAAKKIFAFHGEMGAGKTTFISALCRAKGVSSAVGSPTFSIINQYDYDAGILYHMDLYRLKDEDEALQAGVEDVLYSGHLCLVEWPEKAGGIFPDDTVHVYINALNEYTRQLTIAEV